MPCACAGSLPAMRVQQSHTYLACWGRVCARRRGSLGACALCGTAHDPRTAWLGQPVRYNWDVRAMHFRHSCLDSMELAIRVMLQR